MEPGFAVLASFMIPLLLLLGITAVRGLAAIRAPMENINRIEQKLDLLLQHSGLKFDPFATVPAAVLEALQQRQKIKAIQLYRLKTGTSLKVAKEFVEELERRMTLS